MWQLTKSHLPNLLVMLNYHILYLEKATGQFCVMTAKVTKFLTGLPICFCDQKLKG